MSDGTASSLLSPENLATMQKVIEMTESQISIASALIESLSEESKKTKLVQRQLEAELATRRKSLLEWTQSRDKFSRAYQCVDSGVQSQSHKAHIHEREDNPTATPSDEELAQMLVEQDNNDINAVRAALDARESTISILRSRIADIEQDIAGCKSVSSHTESMMAQQASHKGQLQVLLAQYKSRPPTVVEEVQKPPPIRRGLFK